MFTFTKKWFFLVLLGAIAIAAILHPSAHAKADPDMAPSTWALIYGIDVCNYIDKAGLTGQTLNTLGSNLMKHQDFSPEYAAKVVVYSINWVCPEYKASLEAAIKENMRKALRNG